MNMTLFKNSVLRLGSRQVPYTEYIHKPTSTIRISCTWFNSRTNSRHLQEMEIADLFISASRNIPFAVHVGSARIMIDGESSTVSLGTPLENVDFGDYNLSFKVNGYGI